MKNINALRTLGVFLTALTIFFAGCKVAPNTPVLVPVGFHIHTFIDTNLVDPGVNLNVFFPDSNGRWEELQGAQFYITNMTFHSFTTGQFVTTPVTLILKREENEEYALGNIPADNYDYVQFTVGLNNTLNAGSPSGYTTAADSVLSTAESAMYYGTGQGYKFLTIAGFADTTVAHNGTHLLPFNYSLGGNGDTVRVTMPTQIFTIAPNIPAVQFVHIICDYGKLLQNIQVTNPQYSTGSTYGTSQQQSVATSIWNNIKKIFRYECTTPTGVC